MKRPRIDNHRLSTVADNHAEVLIALLKRSRMMGRVLSLGLLWGAVVTLALITLALR